VYALMTQLRRIRSDEEGTAQTYALACRATDAAVEALKKELGTPTKRSICSTLGKCLAPIRSMEDGGALSLWTRILTPLVEAQDAQGLALWCPYKTPSGGGSPQVVSQYFQVLQRAAKVLDGQRASPEIARAHAFMEEYLTKMRLYVSRELWDPDTSQTAKNPPQERPNLEDLRRRILEALSPYHSVVMGIKNDLLVVVGLDNAVRNTRDQRYIVDVTCIDLKAFALLAQQKISQQGSDNRISAGITGVSIIDDMAYVAVDGLGIIQLHTISRKGVRSADDCQILAEKEGLPFGSITGLAREGEKLWVAYGGQGRESGLGVYDPDSGQWQPVLCSTIAGDSPFSAGTPYTINRLALAAPNRLFFNAHLWVGGVVGWQRTMYDGLWCMNTTTHKLGYRQLDPLDSMVRMEDRGLKCTWLLGVLDPVSRQAVILMAPPQGFTPPPDGTITAVLQRQTRFITEGVLRKFVPEYRTLGGINLSSAAIHDDTLWAPLGTSRLVIMPRGATEEQIVVCENDWLDGRPVCTFLSTPHGLIAIGDRAVGLVDVTTRRVVKLMGIEIQSTPQR
jgi:hypothetical protein